MPKFSRSRRLAGKTFVFFLAAALLPSAAAFPTARGQARQAAARSVFERRILPILKSPDPSSCAECHLSGVDLRDYIRPSERATFASLRDRGMIDLKNPGNSHILRLIRMSAPKTNLVTRKTRDVEYAAFRDWIVAAVKDPGLKATPSVSKGKEVGPSVPNVVIRHARLDTVVASFERNVWSQEGRCMGCHRPGNQENVKKYGERVRWFVPDSPVATMRRLIAQGDINVDKPEESLLLLKPLNKVPHGGGVKMLYGDAGYKMFRAWLEDYAANVKGKYLTVKDLPLPAKQTLVNMDSVLEIADGPASWAGKLLRTDVFAWDAAGKRWERNPSATGERLVYAENNGRPNGTNLIMFLIVPADSAKTEAERLRGRLSPGRYLLKYYCDVAGKLAQDYKIPTDSAEFYQGRQEITAAWFGGWGSPVKVQCFATGSGG